MEECKTCANYKPRLRCGDDQCIAGDGWESKAKVDNGLGVDETEAARHQKLVEVAKGFKMIYPGHQYYYVFLYDEKRRPRVSICYLFDGTYYHRGVAICAPSDYAVLKKLTGAKIARERAETAYREFQSKGKDVEPWGLIRPEYCTWFRCAGAQAAVYFKYLPACRFLNLSFWERYEILCIKAKRKLKADKKLHTEQHATLGVRSACCNAPTRVEWGRDYPSDNYAGVTAWYVCTKCGNSCDIRVPA